MLGRRLLRHTQTHTVLPVSPGLPLVQTRLADPEVDSDLLQMNAAEWIHGANALGGPVLPERTDPPWTSAPPWSS